MAYRPYPQVVLFGDSLFQLSTVTQEGFNFQGQIQSLCIRRHDVINRGFSGWTTRNACGFLSKIFLPPSETCSKIDYLIVLLGANDAVLPLETTAQHVPIQDYETNLRAIITDEILAAHKPSILLVTPPPLDQLRLEALDPLDGHEGAIRHAAVSAAYAQRAREVAKSVPGIILIDLWQAIMHAAIAATPGWSRSPTEALLGSPEAGQSGGLVHFLSDGLHMTSRGYRILYELIAPHLRITPMDDRSTYIFPPWREIEQANEPR